MSSSSISISSSPLLQSTTKRSRMRSTDGIVSTHTSRIGMSVPVAGPVPVPAPAPDIAPDQPPGITLPLAHTSEPSSIQQCQSGDMSSKRDRGDDKVDMELNSCVVDGRGGRGEKVAGSSTSLPEQSTLATLATLATRGTRLEINKMSINYVCLDSDQITTPHPPPPPTTTTTETEEDSHHRDEMYFKIRYNIPTYECLQNRRSGGSWNTIKSMEYVPGEWPLGSLEELKRIESMKKRELVDGLIISTSPTTTTSTSTSNNEVRGYGGSGMDLPCWNGGFEYYLMALWGLAVALIVAMISVIMSLHSPPPVMSSPNSNKSLKRSSSSPVSRRRSIGVVVASTVSSSESTSHQSTEPTTTTTTMTTMTTTTKLPIPTQKISSKHVTFPSAVDGLFTSPSDILGLSFTPVKPQPPRIETRQLSEPVDQPTSPTSLTSVTSHVPELTADEGSNTTSPRSTSPSSPVVDDKKRSSHPGLTFSPIHLPTMGKRDSIDGISPLTSPGGSPQPSRRPSVLGSRPDIHFSRTIASMMGARRESLESSVMRMDSTTTSTKSEETRRRSSSGTATMLRAKLAAAFQRNQTKEKGGKAMSTLHQTLGDTPTISPHSSGVPSATPSFTMERVNSPPSPSDEPPARVRTNSIFSRLNQKHSEEKDVPLTTRPRYLTKSRERRKSTGAYGLNISSPIGPGNRAEQIREMRRAVEAMRERSESAPEIQQPVVVAASAPATTAAAAAATTPGDHTIRSTTPPIVSTATGKPRKVVVHSRAEMTSRLRSNPYDNVPDWSSTVPGYERRRRRKEILQLEDNLKTVHEWLQSDQTSRRNRIKWEKATEKLVDQLNELKRKGMEGKELREFAV